MLNVAKNLRVFILITPNYLLSHILIHYTIIANTTYVLYFLCG
ncbi:Uncharacterised protein [Mycobacteroides abscessus subsp. massiliense]|nr:Uncharacterised protein [Mycobacteroides abscessus subsp. massiliense]